MDDLRRWAASAAVATIVVAVLAASASAQAVCTAPHSSIGIGQGGSVATLFPGTGWLHGSGYFQNADERQRSRRREAPREPRHRALGARRRSAGGGRADPPGVFERELGGRRLTFRAAGDGRFQDAETGSVWSLLGQALEGPLAGRRLEAVPHGNHFWFAWAAFQPETVIWGG